MLRLGGVAQPFSALTEVSNITASKKRRSRTCELFSWSICRMEHFPLDSAGVSGLPCHAMTCPP